MGLVKSRAAQKPTAVFSLATVMDIFCGLFLSAGILSALYKLLPPLERLPRWRAVTRAFSEWRGAGFGPLNAELEVLYYLLIRLSLALLIILALFWLLRRRPPLWLLLTGCAALLAGLSAYGLSDFSGSMYLLSAGLLPLAAGSGAAREPAARARAAAFALPWAVVALLAAFLLLPADTEEWRWQAFSDKIDELYGRYQDWRSSDETVAVDLLAEYHVQLGGAFVPENTAVLLVETSAPLLLKVGVYDYYTGYSWENSVNYLSLPSYAPNIISAHAVPFTSGQNEAELNRFLGFVPEPDSGYPLAGFVRQIDASITMFHPSPTRLFYSGRLTRVYSAAGIEPFVEENSELKTSLPLYHRYKYEFSSLILDRTRPGFSAAVAGLHGQPPPDELAWASRDSGEMKACRQLPTRLIINDEYDATHQMLLEIVDAGLQPGEERSPYEQAVLLERWLKENCRYTLTPPMPPANQDFMLHFLETREGRCTYYATAMVVLARMLDIPARYVTGYSLRPTQRQGEYEATQATAHAWAELFFDGAGWLTFDATGQSDYAERLLSLGEGWEDDRFGAAAVEEGNLAVFFQRLDYRQLGQTVLMVAVLLVICLILLLKLVRLSFSLPRLLKRFSYEVILDIYYRDLMAQLNLLGWQRRPAETILDFARRMGVYLPAQAEQLSRLGAAVSAWRYGEARPQLADLHNAAALHDHFELMVRRELKVAKYYNYRIWHGPAA